MKNTFLFITKNPNSIYPVKSLYVTIDIYSNPDTIEYCSMYYSCGNDDDY